MVYPAGKVAVVLSQPLDEDGAEMEGKCLKFFTIKQPLEGLSISLSMFLRVGLSRITFNHI